MITNKLKYPLIYWSLLPLAFSSFAPLADDEDDSTALEVIQVTATKRKTEMMETSVAISAFSQDMLIQNSVTDARDISNLVPNLDISFSPSDNGIQATMRGVSSNNFTELGDPSVGFHVDGVYSPRPQGAMALMYDLERLEVLRGPQGTLFGRNATAGSINIITKNPEFDEFTVETQIELGQYDHQQLRTTINIPVNDVFALRANYFVERRDGYISQFSDTRDRDGDGIADVDQRRNHEVGNDDYYTNSDRYGFRLSGLWDVMDSLTAKFTYEYYKDKSAGGYIAPDCDQSPEACAHFGGDERTVWTNVPGHLDMDINSYRLNLNYELNDDIALVYNFGFSDQERSQEWDNDMGWFPVPGEQVGWGFSGYRYTPWGDDQYLATRWSDYESTSHEIQLQSINNEQLSWIVGYFDFEEDNGIHFDVEIPFCCGAPAPGGGSFIQPERILESQALFTQGTWHFNDQWHLTLGYRYTEDTKEDRGGRNWAAWGPWVTDANGTRGSFTGGAFGPDEGIDFGLVDSPDYQPTYTSLDLLAGMGAQDYLNNFVINGFNDTKHEFSKSTYRVGLDYNYDTDTLIYASIATGYKAGGFGDGIDITGVGDIKFFSYDPEELINYELGYKAVLLDGSMNFIATIFYSDYKDKQVTTFRKVGVNANTDQDINSLLTENAADATIKGLEIELDWKPTAQSRISGFLAYLDAEYDEWEGFTDGWYCDERADAGLPACAGDGQGDVSGNQLPLSPKYSFTINFEYVFPLGNGGEIKPWISYHWEDEAHLTDTNFDQLAAYSDVRDSSYNLNATIRYTAPEAQWYVELYGNNITDELTKDRIFGGGQYPRYSWNAPRMLGIRLGASF